MLRIARLRTLVAGGDYSVDPLLVADALLRRIAARGPAGDLELVDAALLSPPGAPSPAVGLRRRRAG
jgi:hypothetical protein